MFRGCSGGAQGVLGGIRVYFVLETAQVELKWTSVSPWAEVQAPEPVPEAGRALEPQPPTKVGPGRNGSLRPLPLL